MTAIQIRRSAVAGRAPTSLAPGQLGINTTDGLLFWSDAGGTIQSTPLKNLAQLASPQFTGSPSGPTAAQGDNSQRFATTAFVVAAVNALVAGSPIALNTLKELADALGDDANYAATTAAALGLRLRFDVAQTLTDVQQAQALANLNVHYAQCMLGLSGGNLVLSPRDGNKLSIAGVNRQIPFGGVSLGPAGLAANTVYYIYATWNGSAIILQASTTGHSASGDSRNTGVETMSGDYSKTLVGAAYVITGPAFAMNAAQLYVRSWFNKGAPPLSSSPSSAPNTASTTPVSLWSGVSLLAWANEVFRIDLHGDCSPTSTASVVNRAYLDGSSVLGQVGTGASGYSIPFSMSGSFALSEGVHSVGALGNVQSAVSTSWNVGTCLLSVSKGG